MRPVLLPAVSQTLSLTLVLFGAMGCFSPQPEAFDVETLSFENAFTENDDIVIQPYEYTGLVCPDGSAATFYTVYREGLTEAAPLVILFHSGAFDYVIDPNTDDPLRGDHYRDESRLDGQWANQKIFETLGLVPGDGTEENLGALPAALADAGAFTLYPSNCWGDLWHNEYGYSVNDPSEGFTRNGRYLAWVMSAIASPDPATAVYWQAELGLNDLPIPLDFSSVSLVGLGDGARAIPELFRRSQTVNTTSPASAALPGIRGVIVDSSIDNLYPIVAQPTVFPEIYEGLTRIYSTSVSTDIGAYSLGRWYPERGLTHPLEIAWSSADPQVPNDSVYNLLLLPTTYPTYASAKDYGEAKHVFLNSNIMDARAAVRSILGQ